MSRSRKVLILVLIGLGIFGYTQYASASQIEVAITSSTLVGTGEEGSLYDMKLEFKNPSLLILRAGETEFAIIADDVRIGDGTLEPFTLTSLSSTVVDATFTRNVEVDSAQSFKIDGTIRYDLGVTSINVPFVYYPTHEQAREFIE